VDEAAETAPEAPVTTLAKNEESKAIENAPAGSETPAATEAPAPATPKQAEPTTTEPTSPPSTEKATPITTQPAAPAATEQAAPAATEQAAPAATEQAAPAATEQAAPAATEQAAPATDESQSASAPAGQPAAEPPQDKTQILFPEGSAELPPEATQQLDTIAQKLDQDQSLRLQLMAYASGTEDTASRARRISLSRALAVRAYLIDKGIRSTRMDVRALGNKVEGDPADRVDIVTLTP
jgi:outer membrane protein OmpA-like peptidoglycan-associated protein